MNLKYVSIGLQIIIAGLLLKITLQLNNVIDSLHNLITK